MLYSAVGPLMVAGIGARAATLCPAKVGGVMNWSRGLLRMWVAFTVFWICVVVGFLYLDRPQVDEPIQSTTAGKSDWVVENPKKGANYFDMFDDLIPGTAA